MSWIRDILVRIRILGSVPQTKGSCSGSLHTVPVSGTYDGSGYCSVFCPGENFNCKRTVPQNPTFETGTVRGEEQYLAFVRHTGPCRLLGSLSKHFIIWSVLSDRIRFQLATCLVQENTMYRYRYRISLPGISMSRFQKICADPIIDLWMLSKSGSVKTGSQLLVTYRTIKTSVSVPYSIRSVDLESGSGSRRAKMTH